MAPSEVVAQQAIRKAMGISYEPATTDAAVGVQNPAASSSSVAAAEPSSKKQQELDADINDFFTPRTADQPIVL